LCDKMEEKVYVNREKNNLKADHVALAGCKGVLYNPNVVIYRI